MKTYITNMPIIALFAFWLAPAMILAQGIEIPNGGSIVCSGAATIEVSNGNFINNGTYTKGAETFIMSGVTTPGFISGTALSDFNNLTITNTAGVSIANNSKVTVSGALSVSSSSLTLKSTGDGTASLIHSTSGVTGKVEKYITGGWGTWDEGWHQISSPVTSQAIFDFTTTGVGNDYDFYGWDEPTNTWMNFKGAGFSSWNGGTDFNVGQGYLISYEQTQSGKSFIGVLNVLDVTKTNLTRTGAFNYTGWHLLGNPFASAVKWNDGNWALSNVAGNAKIWHETNKSYSDIAAGGFLPAEQGFMVQVNSVTNGLTIPAASREHNAAAWYKSGMELQRIFLVASESEGNSAQESQVLINPQATDAFDFDFDSRFLAGYAPQFYSYAGDEMLSTNARPAIQAETVIPFGFVKNGATNFSIELKEQIEGFTVYLTDKITGTVCELSSNPLYNFTSAEGDEVNRFTLHFSSLGSVENPAAARPEIYAFGKAVYITSSRMTPANITILNLTGQLVRQSQLMGNSSMVLDLSNLPGGVYVVIVSDGNLLYSSKIVLK